MKYNECKAMKYNEKECEACGCDPCDCYWGHQIKIFIKRGFENET